MFKEIDYDKHFVIGTPLVAWKVERNEHLSWLYEIDNIKNKFKNAKFFAALELDSRSVEDSYGNFLDILKSKDIAYWTYSINDNESRVTSGNRLIRIETGRNLVREFTQRGVQDQSGIEYDAVLYVDSDIILTAEIIEKMFEVDRHIVSVDVPAYCLGGKVINENPRIEEHWNTAGMLLVNSPYYYDLSWYHNNKLGLTDDPAFQHMAERLYGQTWVRKDIIAHHNGLLVGVEDRRISDRIL